MRRDLPAAVEWSQVGRLLVGALRVPLATISRYDAALHVSHHAVLRKGMNTIRVTT